MGIEWDFLQGPLALVSADLVRAARDHARHCMIVRVGISSNPLLSLVGHEDHEQGTKQPHGDEKLVCIYETRDLDEAIAARDLVATAIGREQSFPIIVSDTGNSILEEDEDLPWYVYLLTDTAFVFTEKDTPPA